VVAMLRDERKTKRGDARIQVPSPAPVGEEGFALQLSRRTVLAGLASLGLTPVITPARAASSETTDTTDIFRIGVPARAITTDPSVTSDMESHRLAPQISRNLISADPETGETIAERATDWTLRDDGLKLDLQLQQDVTFHDGTKLTADVVVKNFDRWGNANKLLGADLLRQVGRLPYSVVFGGYFNQDACLLDSVEAASKHVVTLHMSQPVQRL